MEAPLAWAILGLALVIAELLTGTFYLLMLGAAAFGSAAAAWLGWGFEAQVIVFALVAGVGCYGVHVYRARNSAGQMPSIDAGNPAVFEAWVDEAARLARVRYRGAPWDAQVEGAELPQPGARVYVRDADGNTLKVAARPPA